MLGADGFWVSLTREIVWVKWVHSQNCLRICERCRSAKFGKAANKVGDRDCLYLNTKSGPVFHRLLCSANETNCFLSWVFFRAQGNVN